MADRYYRDVAIYFDRGALIINVDGQGPAKCFLTADLTGTPSGWVIAAVYLESLDSDERSKLDGPMASAMANVLYADPKFTAWAEDERQRADACHHDMDRSPYSGHAHGRGAA